MTKHVSLRFGAALILATSACKPNQLDNNSTTAPARSSQHTLAPAGNNTVGNGAAGDQAANPFTTTIPGANPGTNGSLNQSQIPSTKQSKSNSSNQNSGQGLPSFITTLINFTRGLFNGSGNGGSNGSANGTSNPSQNYDPNNQAAQNNTGDQSGDQSVTPSATPSANTDNVGTLPAASTPSTVSSFGGTHDCSPGNYGLPTGAAPGTVSQYPKNGDLSQLPSLSTQASNADIKQFVITVYHLFPVFSQVYEVELGLSEAQALAFMYADMSRESAGDHGWQIALETGWGSAGHAWGPFQAAVTNFYGGGYDSVVEDGTGLPIPDMSKFFDPPTSTYAGMKRLADGILNAIKVLGPGKSAKDYMLATLADHNTGVIQSATDPGWLGFYGTPVLEMMDGYLYKGANLTNNFYISNGEPSSQYCQ